jgi:hypothetical protein
MPKQPIGRLEPAEAARFAVAKAFASESSSPLLDAVELLLAVSARVSKRDAAWLAFYSAVGTDELQTIAAARRHERDRRRFVVRGA